MKVEQRLAELGITLPQAQSPVANYVGAVQTGNLLFLSGRGPVGPDGALKTGLVGSYVTVEEAYVHARLVGLQLIATMKEALGDLDRVVRVVKLLGMVNSAPGFNNTPGVIHGASDLLLEVFGENGRHARSAVGMQIPGDYAVEVEIIFEVK